MTETAWLLSQLLRLSSYPHQAQWRVWRVVTGEKRKRKNRIHSENERKVPEKNQMVDIDPINAHNAANRERGSITLARLTADFRCPFLFFILRTRRASTASINEWTTTSHTHIFFSCVALLVFIHKNYTPDARVWEISLFFIFNFTMQYCCWRCCWRIVSNRNRHRTPSPNRTHCLHASA